MNTKDSNGNELNDGDRVTWRIPPHLGLTSPRSELREATVIGRRKGGWFVIQDGSGKTELVKPGELTKEESEQS